MYREYPVDTQPGNSLRDSCLNPFVPELTRPSLTGTVAQLVELPLCDREVAGSIPGRVIPKTLKTVLAALSLGAQH